MPRKTTAPTGAIAQTEQPQVSSIETLLANAVAQAQSERVIIHDAMTRISQAQAEALLPYMNGSFLNAAVVNTLATFITEQDEVGNTVPSILEVFELECEEVKERAQNSADDAVLLLSEWTGQSEERVNNARYLISPSSSLRLAAGADSETSADTWDAEEVTVSDD
jgi:hypothetical protein